MTDLAPTDPVAIAGRLAALPAEDRTGLVELLEQRGEEFGVFPLSSAQRRMWLLAQVHPDNPVYNLPFAFRVDGTLDQTALDGALNDLVRRHESLRTLFVTVGEEPRQVVLDGLRVRLRVERYEPGAATGEWVTEHCDAEARRPFDLTTGPLLRACLLAPDSADATLMVTVHHIVCDGWSLSVMFGELSRLYRARSRGDEDGLGPAELQFADFTVWQRERMRGDLRAGLLDHWRQRLDGAPTLLELPADRTRPTVRSLAGRLFEFAWPEELETMVTRFSRQEGVTPYATLLAGFASVVHRHTGRQDMLIATPMANRTRAETEKVVGCFINTVPLRIRLTGQTDFRSLARAAHHTISDAQDNQELPFEDLVTELRPDRDLSHDPLVQLLFVLQNVDADIELPGAVLQPRTVHGGGSIFDFSMALRQVGPEHGGGLEGYVEYSTDLFEQDTVRRFTGHLRTLLEGALADPDTPVAELPLLTEVEADRLRSWNTSDITADDGDLVALFEDWAERTPDATALVGDAGSRTYRELEARANQLAHHLAASGVRPGSTVGVALERSLDLPAVFLGILKAGAVYVPLDTGYPADRLSYMIKNAGVTVLVTRSDVAGVPETDRMRVIRLDKDARSIGSHPTSRPERALSPDDAAYVIYTSGSTGQPKGTSVTHRGIRNCALAQRELFRPAAEDTILQFASPSFDASTFEFVLALACGARLCVVPRARLLPGPDLIATARQYDVTLTVLPPTVLGVLSPGDLPSVRALMVAGEACPPEVVAAWAPRHAFYNLYGPTEASIWSTVARCDGTEHRPPIGSRVRGTTAHVLDARMRPVPIGVPGELYVGGAGVARGYLGRPGLTARHFTPDPFSGRPRARLYRTGDLVRRLPGGDLDYLGRIDRQVKIRGHRIELPEIEAHLERLPEVDRGVVMARADDSGHLRLVAYVRPAAPSAGADLDADHLRRQLRMTLPEYMVPGVIVPLDDLPLNGNGKIDYKRLPAPPRSRQTATRVAPVSRLERDISAVWQELLGLDEVDVHDNFFDLGGDSLLLARARTRLAELLGQEVATLLLFAHPTVHDLAIALADDLDDSADRRTSATGGPRSERPDRRALLSRSRRTGSRR
ncbi:MAG: non-ribosomal peptide synthetase [Actinoallomurus sp.]